MILLDFLLAEVALQEAFESLAMAGFVDLPLIKTCATLGFAYNFLQLCYKYAEKYQAEFKAVCAESLAMKVPYVYVQNWFKKTFPNYGKLPERNAELKIINTPANYDAEEDIA